jgi:hypothetical protein
MIKLKELLKEEKEQLDEVKLPQLKIPVDLSYYNRDWGKVFDYWADSYEVDFGPRESDMYDWNDRNNYRNLEKEFNAHMAKVAKKLNDASKGLQDPWKVWNKMQDKWRKKDKS